MKSTLLLTFSLLSIGFLSCDQESLDEAIGCPEFEKLEGAYAFQLKERHTIVPFDKLLPRPRPNGDEGRKESVDTPIFMNQVEEKRTAELLEEPDGE